MIQKPLLTYIPASITNSAIITYLAALVACNLLFISHPLYAVWWVFGIVEVLIFFYVANYTSKAWSFAKHYNTKWFEHRLIYTAFFIRFIFVCITYLFYKQQCGDAFGYDDADAPFYNQLAHDLATWYHEETLNPFDCLRAQYGFGSGERYAVAWSDSGYGIYLSVIYFLTGNGDASLFIERVMKCIWGAWTVLLIYRIGKRNFGEETGRMAAILCMLMPTLWYYCGTQLKEVEMVFLVTLFVERADALLRGGHFSILPTIGLVAIVFFMTMIRTAAAITMVLALLTALLFSSSKVIGWGRRILIGAIAVVFLLLMLFQNSAIFSEVSGMAEERGSGQQANMEWRSRRDNGNQFAKYAGAAVFAPLIFTIPFPTMTDTPGQEVQKMQHGGNFCKNITSFFTIFALFVLLFSGQWRKSVLPIAMLCGYLVVLAFSSFAQSERFHQPIIPLALLFAAYGISHIRDKRQYMQYYQIWCIGIFMACLVWNWFKLAGRGMI